MKRSKQAARSLCCCLSAVLVVVAVVAVVKFIIVPALAAPPAPDPAAPYLFHYQTATRVLDKELASHSHGNFSKEYRNPCWQPYGHLRCLPYFYVSGFHTGAGALAKRLGRHPDVVLDAANLSYWGAAWGFWSEYRNTLEHYIGGISHRAGPSILSNPRSAVVMDGSLSTFSLYWAASGKAHRAFSEASVGCWRECHQLAGSSTSAKYDECMELLCLPKGRAADHAAARRAGLHYTDLQLPMLMRGVYGAQPPKMVFLFRDPVERIYSAFWGLKVMRTKYGSDFTGFVKEQLDGLRRCVHGPPLVQYTGNDTFEEHEKYKKKGPLGWLSDDTTRRRLAAARRLTVIGAIPVTEPFFSPDRNKTRNRPPGILNKERDCASYFESLRMEQEKVFFHGDQLFRGMYSTWLNVWLRYFPRSSILIVKSSDYFADPRATTQRVLRFLELGYPSGAQWKAMEAAGPAVSNVQNKGRMPAAAEEMLRDFYWPYNQELATVLGDPSILEWNRDTSRVEPPGVPSPTHG